MPEVILDNQLNTKDSLAIILVTRAQTMCFAHPEAVQTTKSRWGKPWGNTSLCGSAHLPLTGSRAQRICVRSMHRIN